MKSTPESFMCVPSFRDGVKHDMYMGSRNSGGSSNSSPNNGESYDDNFPELTTSKFSRMRLVDNNSPTNEAY
jgi:hypothetical protein